MTNQQELTIKQAITRAKKAIKQGNTAIAMQLYNTVLQHQPNHPIAKKGLKKLQKERPHSQSIQAQTTHPPQGQMNALVNLYHSGQMAQTERACRELQQAYPQTLLIINILGVALYRQGKLQEAVQEFNKAIALNPDYAEAYSNRGNALSNLGQLKEALESFERAIALKPDYTEAYNNRGNTLRDLGQLKEAVESYEKAIALKPDYAEAYNNRGNVLRNLEQLEEAVESYEKAIVLKPDLGNAHTNLCDLYETHNMIPELKNALHHAQAILPSNDPELLFIMALLASREKRFEDARNFLELITPARLLPGTRQRHSELLSKTYDKLCAFSNAFSQFEITNNIVKQSVAAQQFSAQRYFKRISKISESWASTAKIKWPILQTPTEQNTPVFLVGFPRSGTTLLDTILRSHPDVLVIEEKHMVESMQIHAGSLATSDLLTGLNTDQINKLRDIYYEELYSHIEADDSHKIIIDKLPLNIIDVGLIHRVFPKSKFILALRHPYDCVLSCFMQNFKLNDAMANFLTLQQSARLYDAVMRLWVHYNNSLDLEVGILKYEDLTQNLQGTAEPLLNFLGLNWHDNLLNYQQTALSRGRIKTPSYNQVTQSLYTQATDRWKNYQDQMKEIVPLLEPWAKRFGYSTEL